MIGPDSPARHPRRIPELDGLRAVAILAVFVHHALNVPLLWMGVDLFFVLSGFLITGILLDRKESGRSFFSYFYERRARRILVPYIVLLAVSSLFFGTSWMRYWYWYAFFGTNIASALHQTGHDSLGPLWSLAVEEQFYLFWPVVVLMASKKTLFRLAASALLIVPALRALATPLFETSFPIFYLTPFRMDLLCAGALLALLFRDNKALPAGSGLAAYFSLAFAALLLLFLSRYPDFRTGSNTVLTNVLLYSLVLVIVSSLLAIALTGKGPFCSLLRWAPLRWIGIISYSMYLVHETAIVLSRNFFGNVFIAAIVALAATVLYAAATWYGFEKRLLNPKKVAILSPRVTTAVLTAHTQTSK